MHLGEGEQPGILGDVATTKPDAGASQLWARTHTGTHCSEQISELEIHVLKIIFETHVLPGVHALYSVSHVNCCITLCVKSNNTAARPPPLVGAAHACAAELYLRVRHEVM